MEKIFSIFKNFIAWIATPLIVMCPLCTFTAVFIALGQLSFLFTISKLLTPILILLISVSIFSFYLSFRINRNLFPLVLAALGGASIIYANVGYLTNIMFQIAGIVLLSSAALIDINVRFLKG